MIRLLSIRVESSICSLIAAIISIVPFTDCRTDSIASTVPLVESRTELIVALYEMRLDVSVQNVVTYII
jgi:hypothetical protein